VITLKVFGRNIRIPFITEKFKGFFDTGKSTREGTTHFYSGEHTWRSRCVKYDKLVERHPMAKQAVTTIAGQLIAEGVFTAPADRDGETYPRAEEAQQRCDDLNEFIGLDTMLYDTGIILAKYGSCFWEKTWTPEFNVRIIPMQEAIEPSAFNDIGEITEWRQNLWGTKTSPTWPSEEIIHFSWNVTSQSWPYGTSILVGLDTELEILEQLEENAKDYMTKQAWPYELWQIGNGEFMPTGSDINEIKSKWKNRAIGENMISTYPIDAKQGGTGGAPLRELAPILDFIYDSIIDGTMVPPISKQYNATEASAKVMMPHAHATLITPMQRLIRRKIENEIYKPYLEDLGYSVRTCPKLLFEPPDARKPEDAEFWSKMQPFVPPIVVAREFGWEDEFVEWQKEKEAKQEEMMKQQKNGGEEDGPKEEGGDVWEVRRKTRGNSQRRS